MALDLVQADKATLRLCLRDVVALSSLPSMWRGLEPQRIAESLAAALHTALNAEFVYVTLREPQGTALASIAQTSRHNADPQFATEIGPALLDWTRRHDPHDLLPHADPRWEAPLRVTCRPIGINAELGLIAAGFRAEEAPSPLHHLLLDVAISQVMAGFTNALLVRSLKQSEERFRALVTASSYVVYRMSPDWSEMRELKGGNFISDTAEPSRMWLHKYIHPDDQQHVMEAINEAVRSKRVFELEHRVRRVDGTLGWTLSRAVPLLNAAGEIVEWFGAANDVTARKRAEEELIGLNESLEQRISERVQELAASAEQLRESEGRFRLLLEAITDYAIFMLDVDGNIASWNPGAERIKGYTRDEIIGRHFSIFYTEEDRLDGLPARVLAQATRAGKCEIEGWRVRKDASRFWGNVVVHAIRDDSGALLGFTKVTRDMTEQRTASEQLRQSQKMEAVGQLTGGVAHDFNNVLQIIGGNLQLLTRDVAGNLRSEQRLQTAIAAISRGSKLASQLLAFGRRQPLAPKVVNLGRMIRSIDDMLRRALGEGIEIETMIAGGLWNTFVDTVQVENALLNLAINARDAMNGQGKLTVEVGNSFLDDQYAERHADVAAGQYVMIAVTDTGSGIPAEIVERVFEPFFTTKPEGQGTGLGLSMVYGFVKQSGGHIKIYSEPGHGTTVRIYLPRARELEDVETNIETGPATGGTETILVVEDDEEVRGTVVDMLSELGYRVLKAKDAQSGLAIIESGVPIDLLFTDVVMPGPLRSPELARKAQERLPGLAVLFTSGYTENAIVHGGRVDEGVELLSKPYTREAVARKIRHVLRNHQQRIVARATQQAVSKRKADGDGTALPTGALRILLIEDDSMIRLSTTEMLESLGHSVTGAANAKMALELLDRSRFDVIVTDLALPDVPGDEIAARAVVHQPGLRVIFATGYGTPPATAWRDGLEGAVMLQKPYDEQQIEDALKAATSRTNARGKLDDTQSQDNKN